MIPLQVVAAAFWCLALALLAGVCWNYDRLLGEREAHRRTAVRMADIILALAKLRDAENAELARLRRAIPTPSPEPEDQPCPDPPQP